MRQVVSPIGRLLIAAMIMLIMAINPPSRAGAQQIEATTSVADLQALAVSIEDELKRKELLATIRALIAAKEGGATAEPHAPLSERIITYTTERVRAAEEAIGDLSVYFRNWPLVAEWIRREINDPVARVAGLNNAAAFVGIFAVGWLAEYLLWRLLAKTRRQIDQAAKRSGPARLLPIMTRAAVELLPLLAFAGGAYSAALLFQPALPVRTIGLNFVNAYLVSRVLMAGARLLLSPGVASMRVLPLPDVATRALFLCIRRFVVIGVGGFFVIAAAVLLGVPRRGAEALFMALGCVLVIVGGAFVLRHRRAVAGWLRHQSAAASSRLGVAQLIQTLAAIWHILAIGYLIGFFIVAAFAIEGGFVYMARGTVLSLLIIAAAWLVLLCGQWLLDRLLPPLPIAEIESSSLRYRISLYRPTIDSVLRVIVVAFAGLVLLQAWGIDALRWIEQPAAKRTLGAAISIGLVFIFAVLAWEIASHSIARYSMQDQDGKGIQRSAADSHPASATA